MNDLNKVFIQAAKTLETFEEANDHLLKYLKEKNIRDFIYMFSTLIEAYSSIERHMNVHAKADSEIQGSLKKINKLLELLLPEVEKANYVKLNEILVFSFMPAMKSLKIVVTQRTNVDNSTKVIGVYYCAADPKKAIGETRTTALVDANKKFNSRLVFFESDGVNFDSKEIKGEEFISGTWKTVSIPFPDVIYNVFPKQKSLQSKIEKKLRKEVPFTTFNIGNKVYLPKKLLESRKYAELLVPFKGLTDITVFKNFMRENEKIVVKPIAGRQGREIFFIEKIKDRFIVSEHTKSSTFTYFELIDWVEELIKSPNHKFIIQKYVTSRTSMNEPYDIRAHVQKDGEGAWVITRIYMRVGNSKSILSNISRGGRSTELQEELIKKFGKLGGEIENELKILSLDLARHIDKLYNFSIDELGLDLAVDESQKVWLHEVNSGPQTTYHEDERAENVIAYALYLAKNQMFLTNEFEKRKRKNGHFSYRNHQLEEFEMNNMPTVGMLIDKSELDAFAIAAAYCARFEDVNLYCFTREDIDYEKEKVRGHFYEHGEWVTKVTNYPDSIYDRLRMRGQKHFQEVYDEFTGIPFTNNFYGDSTNKLAVYDALLNTKEINNILIPYQPVSRLKDIANYLDKYNEVVLKPEVGSFGRGVYLITKNHTGNYSVFSKEDEQSFSEFGFNDFVRKLLKGNKYLVQEYIQTRTIDDKPFDIRVHLLKNGEGKWAFAAIIPRIGLNSATITLAKEGGYVSKIDGFLKRNFNHLETTSLIEGIKNTSIKIANLYDDLHDNAVSELALDLAISPEGELFLIEVNVNKPGIVYYEFEVAKLGVAYAKYLAINYREEKVLTEVIPSELEPM